MILRHLLPLPRHHAPTREHQPLNPGVRERERHTEREKQRQRERERERERKREREKQRERDREKEKESRPDEELSSPLHKLPSAQTSRLGGLGRDWISPSQHGMAAMRCEEFGYGYGCASEHISCWIQPACLRQHCRQSQDVGRCGSLLLN